MSDSLTAKQEQFCQEYLIDLNGKQAAIRAGYSEDSATSTASEILTYPNVQARLAELMEARRKRCQVSQDDVVLELKRIGFSDMKDFAKWDGDSVEFFDSEELDEDKTRCVESVSQTVTKEGGSHSIKLHSKPKALELLAKHLLMLTDKVAITNPDGSLKPDNYSDKEKAAIAKTLRVVRGDTNDAATVEN